MSMELGSHTAQTPILQPNSAGSEQTVFLGTAKSPLHGTLRAMLHLERTEFPITETGRMVGRAVSLLSRVPRRVLRLLSDVNLVPLSCNVLYRTI